MGVSQFAGWMKGRPKVPDLFDFNGRTTPPIRELLLLVPVGMRTGPVAPGRFMAPAANINAPVTNRSEQFHQMVAAVFQKIIDDDTPPMRN